MRDPARSATLRAALVGTPARAVLTLLCLAAAVAAALHGARWAIVDAVWQGDAVQCRNAAGACWAYVREKANFFLFGSYPRAEIGRARMALCVMLASLFLMVLRTRAPTARGVLGLAGLATSAWLLFGGLGLAPVPAASLGGLPLTLLLSSASILVGLPAGLLLALARQRGTRIVRVAAAIFIDALRCSPLVALLFIAAFVAPLVAVDFPLPSKLVRIMTTFALMASAYIAEVMRGALQALPAGQRQAALALGMTPARTLFDIELPQAIRLARVGLLGVAITFFKETSLVAVVGLYDLLGAARLANQDSAWMGYDTEGYVAVAAIYFALCWALAYCATPKRG